MSALLLAGCTAAGMVTANAGTTADRIGFVVHTPAFIRTPTVGQREPRVECPGSAACHNYVAEPSVAAGPDGTIWATGNMVSSPIWRSVDGGRHTTALGEPDLLINQKLPAGHHVTSGPDGADDDVAVAPVTAPGGPARVYVAANSIFNVSLLVSEDNGASWRVNPAVAAATATDRPFVAADGASTVCVEYHALAAPDLRVSCSIDAGHTFRPGTPVLTSASAHGSAFAAIPGQLAFDHHSHRLYLVFGAPASAAAGVAQELSGSNRIAMFVAHSDDLGRTWSTSTVAVPTERQPYGYNGAFDSIAVDVRGRVYAVTTDQHSVFYAVSSDGGERWSALRRVSPRSDTTTVEPWVVAGARGRLDVVWYGTSAAVTGSSSSVPPTAAWTVHMAQIVGADSAGPWITQAVVSGVVHHGPVCLRGISCPQRNRDLFDDFGVTADPRTGRAVVVYNSDQFVADSRRLVDPDRCTRADNDTPGCVHVEIAAQVSGPTLVG